MVALTKQVAHGKYRPDVSPEVGFLDVVGNDRRWGCEGSEGMHCGLTCVLGFMSSVDWVAALWRLHDPLMSVDSFISSVVSIQVHILPGAPPSANIQSESESPWIIPPWNMNLLLILHGTTIKYTMMVHYAHTSPLQVAYLWPLWSHSWHSQNPMLQYRQTEKSLGTCIDQSWI